MNLIIARCIIAALTAATAFCPLAAAQTSFSYDARGRLTRSCTVNGPIDGALSTWAFDKADNRVQSRVAQTGFVLTGGQSIHSPDGRFTFVMQTDGNLVLYGPSSALWASSTFGSGYSARFQGAGNLVVYTASGQAVWGSDGAFGGCETLQVQNDGNVMISRADGSVRWATNTGNH